MPRHPLDQTTMSETPIASTGPHRKVFYGWWVVLAVCVTSFYIAGIFWWGFAVFFASLLDEFGWSRAQISLALTLQGIEGVGAAPIVGLLVDRVGTRRLMIFGLATAGLGLILLSWTHSLVWFYAAFVVISVGTSTGTGIVSQSLVVRWFYRRRGMATTALMLMPGLGATLIIPLLTMSIEAFGWRHTLFFAGVGVWITALPVLLFVKNSPESVGMLPDGDPPANSAGQPDERGTDLAQEEHAFTLKAALRLSSFWTLTASFALWNLAGSGVQPHLFVAFLGIGMDRARAATFTALLPGLSLIGRLGFGLLSDAFSKRYLLLVTGAAMAVGMVFLAALMLVPSRPWLAIPFVVFYSIGFGGSIPLRIVISSQYFGRRHFPAIYGTMQAVTAAGGVGGPIFAGWLYDITGSYFIPFAIGSVLMLGSLPLVLFLVDPRRGLSNSATS